MHSTRFYRPLNHRASASVRVIASGIPSLVLVSVFGEVRTLARANAQPVTCADVARVKTGDKFGHWTVTRVETETRSSVAHGEPCQCIWGWPRADATPGTCVPYTFTEYRMLCRCQCGTVKHVNPWNLVNGQSFSCGCRRNDWQLKREASRDSKRKAA
jgi:hypothetical protein